MTSTFAVIYLLQLSRFLFVQEQVLLLEVRGLLLTCAGRVVCLRVLKVERGPSFVEVDQQVEFIDS